ncbi:SDR family NAD(P)-dependent oxidoreductase [Tuberibacillus calidus]|uniref:SDR family NAD(P)-dependent oxidoreductase n=1 Tax=Tuberibacillus calidus TaxID=340097 RepID=UPI000486A24D|nr:glucose 1-dehydrogenase [Tuberibacillus calidus]
MMLPFFRLDGRMAIVTGGGRGIGQALALGLAEAGADVAVIARTKDDLEKTVRMIEEAGRKGIAISADVTSREAVHRAVRKVADEWGRIDILVNNAGMNIRTKALEVTDDEWHKIMETNLHSAFMMAQETAKVMKDQGKGKIINITSVGGHVALRTGVVYAATKAAIIQMTKNLAMEWAQYGINVNAIGPWYFKTPLTEKLLADKAYLNDILARTPIKRVGELEDLVGPVVFLAGDGADYITGQTLFVDGGMTIYGF